MMNEVGPNFIGYFKHLASELLTDSEMVQLPFPEFKKERLKMILDESVDCIIRETDTITDQIIALSCQLQNSDECIKDCGRKRKALSSPSKDSGNADILNQKAVEKVYNDTGALQGNAEIYLKALEKYSAEAQAKLDQLEEGLEEFLNIIFSKCRIKNCPQTDGAAAFCILNYDHPLLLTKAAYSSICSLLHLTLTFSTSSAAISTTITNHLHLLHLQLSVPPFLAVSTSISDCQHLHLWLPPPHPSPTTTMFSISDHRHSLPL